MATALRVRMVLADISISTFGMLSMQFNLSFGGHFYQHFLYVGIFFNCTRGIMPTDENLMKRGCIVVSACDLCLSQFESTTYLFLSCSFATHLWNWLGSLFRIVFNTNIFYTLFESFATNWSAYLTNIATVGVLHVLHSIWLARSSIRFNNAKIIIHTAKMKVLSSIKMSAALVTEFPSDAEQ
jgi:hypothetical protein